MKRWLTHRAALSGARALATRLAGRGSLAASIVIATRNRATYLDLTLAALEQQIFPADAWEVIVVDDASCDHTATVVEQHERRAAIAVKADCFQVAQGRLRALNRALEMASGRIVIFLGDDQIAHSDFLVRHLMCHLEDERVVLGDSSKCVHTHLYAVGYLTVEALRPMPAFTVDDPNWMEALQHLTFDNQRPGDASPTSPGIDGSNCWLHFNTSHSSAPRERLLGVGAFDEGFSTWNMGEWGLGERELAYRLDGSGLMFHRSSQARALRQLSPGNIALSTRLQPIHNLDYFFTRHQHLDRAHLEPLLRNILLPPARPSWLP